MRESGTIVCGVAAAATANRVVDVGRRLAAAYGARLTVVHAFDEPVVETEETMEAIRAATTADKCIEIRLVEGAPTKHLLEIAESEHADWIVVGSSSRGPVATTLGSVSQRLSQSAPCPVVVVPTIARTEQAASIVCGVDGSEHSFAAATLAGELGRSLGLRVIVVHAPRTLRSLVGYLGRETTPSLGVQPDTAVRKTQQIIAQAVEAVGDPATETIVERGRPDRVLSAVAARENAQMIVIAARGVSPVHAALLGSVAVSLTSSPSVSVVVLPESAEKTIVSRSIAPAVG